MKKLFLGLSLVTSLLTAPAAQATPPFGQTCEPLSNHGTCYRPGEMCRDRDHGVVGIDFEGNTIKCVNNDGWRWEG